MSTWSVIVCVIMPSQIQQYIHCIQNLLKKWDLLSKQLEQENEALHANLTEINLLQGFLSFPLSYNRTALLYHSIKFYSDYVFVLRGSEEGDS